MKCYECGGTYVEKRGPVDVPDKYIGEFTVEEVQYSECDGCGEHLYSPEACDRIEAARNRALDEILQSQPLKAFVSGAEAAAVPNLELTSSAEHR